MTRDLEGPTVLESGFTDLAVNAMTQPMQVREDSPPYGGERP